MQKYVYVIKYEKNLPLQKISKKINRICVECCRTEATEEKLALSGYDIIDDFFENNVEENAHSYEKYREWIHCDHFEDIKIIDENHNLFMATWLDGEKLLISQNDDIFIKTRSSPIKVILSIINETDLETLIENASKLVLLFYNSIICDK